MNGKKKSGSNPEFKEREIVRGLSRLLADSYTLSLKTHNFHWNVMGPMFIVLHGLFEGQYDELHGAVDTIAERIRMLGALAPGSFAEFGKLTSIKESNGNLDANAMVAELLTGHELVLATIKSVYPAAEKEEDEATLDLLTERLQVHEKAAWMLRSTLGK